MKSLTLTLDSVVLYGSTIKVKTSQPALAVTDNAGNTYTRASKKDAKRWIAKNHTHGRLTVTATVNEPDLIMTVKEYV